MQELPESPTLIERLQYAIDEEGQSKRPCPDLLAFLGDLKARAEAGEDIEEEAMAAFNDLYC